LLAELDDELLAGNVLAYVIGSEVNGCGVEGYWAMVVLLLLLGLESRFDCSVS
jgi:hypothetical protein